jgi:hypothetical protein
MSSVIGGGTGFLIREPHTLLSSPSPTFNSFEMSTVTLKLLHSKLTVFNIYRPPPSSAKSRDKASFSQFLNDFQNLLSIVCTVPHEFLITGDFNIHVDDPDSSEAKQFLSVLDLFNLTQHVTFPTHRHSHILDLVITTADSTLSPTISFSPTSPSDHLPILSSLSIIPPIPLPLTEHHFRSLHSISINSFTRDILSSRLITQPPSELPDLVDCYNSTLSSLLDKYAPLKSKISVINVITLVTPSLKKLKLTKRRLEHAWSRSHSADILKLLHSANNHYHVAIIKAIRSYNSTLITSTLLMP